MHDYDSEGQKRAQDMMSNPRYWQDGLTPEAYTEKVFPDYHQDIIDSISSNLNLENKQVAPIEHPEINQILQLMSAGANHAQKAAEHHINEDYPSAHAALVAAGTSYDIAARLVKSITTRNHGIANEIGAVGAMSPYSHKGMGATYANAYKQVMQRKGLM